MELASEETFYPSDEIRHRLPQGIHCPKGRREKQRPHRLECHHAHQFFLIFPVQEPARLRLEVPELGHIVGKAAEKA
jgi:hypothetical protein